MGRRPDHAPLVRHFDLAQQQISILPDITSAIFGLARGENSYLDIVQGPPIPEMEAFATMSDDLAGVPSLRVLDPDATLREIDVVLRGSEEMRTERQWGLGELAAVRKAFTILAYRGGSEAGSFLDT